MMKATNLQLRAQSIENTLREINKKHVLIEFMENRPRKFSARLVIIQKTDLANAEARYRMLINA